MHGKRILTTALSTAVALLLLAGCQPPPQGGGEDLGEIREQQKQILAKLEALDKKLDKVQAAPAPKQRASGPDPAKVYDLPVGASDVLGPAEGVITITEFSDYQCPFCARSEPIIHEALDAYPTQARFVYKHFPLTSIHKQALPAAHAAVAAQKQGKFWEMHELMFKNQRALQDDNLEAYAAEIGLDVDQFKKDMASDAVKQQVAADMALAQKVGVRGTPTIFVNGKLLQNRSLDGFKDLIDPLLKEKAKS
jgi:protein-disulfide isomerase